jgi:hypothetical protein
VGEANVSQACQEKGGGEMSDSKAKFIAWANQYRNWLMTPKFDGYEVKRQVFLDSVKPILIGIAKEARETGIDVTNLWDTIGKFSAIPPAELEQHLDHAWVIAQQLPAVEPPSGYSHPILALSDELRASPGSRKNWNRPEVADEYVRRHKNASSEDLRQLDGDKVALRTKYVNLLRNRKSELKYP